LHQDAHSMRSNTEDFNHLRHGSEEHVILPPTTVTREILPVIYPVPCPELYPVPFPVEEHRHGGLGRALKHVANFTLNALSDVHVGVYGPLGGISVGGNPYCRGFGPGHGYGNGYGNGYGYGYPNEGGYCQEGYANRYPSETVNYAQRPGSYSDASMQNAPNQPNTAYEPLAYNNNGYNGYNDSTYNQSYENQGYGSAAYYNNYPPATAYDTNAYSQQFAPSNYGYNNAYAYNNYNYNPGNCGGYGYNQGYNNYGNYGYGGGYGYGYGFGGSGAINLMINTLGHGFRGGHHFRHR